MRIVHQNNIDFNIAGNGNIECQSSWCLTANAATNNEQQWSLFQDVVKNWAGEIGDNWRRPTHNSCHFEEDPNYVTTAITITSLSRGSYEVKYNGVRKNLNAKMLGGVTEHVNKNEEREKRASWQVNTNSDGDWLPKIGEVMTWAGDFFLCSDIKQEELPGNELKVTIAAKDMAILQLGNCSYSKNHQGERVAKGKWRVSSEHYAQFMEDNDINRSAYWAGENFFVSSIISEPNGGLGYEVTIEAKNANFRLLDVKRTEVFKGFSSTDGSTQSDITWQGRWQIHKDRLPEYEGIVGNSADEWAATGAIITKVTPLRITDMLYEIVVDATLSSSALTTEYDDRSNLATRVDVSVENISFPLTHRECDWQENTKGKLTAIEEWSASSECPFVASEPLSQALVDKHPTCMLVTEGRYLKGEASKHVQLTLLWNAGPKVITTKIGGVQGTWLQRSIVTNEIFDNQGAKWTKLTCSYAHAPAGLNWNPNYRGF